MIARHVARGRHVDGQTPAGRKITIWLPKGEQLPVVGHNRKMVIVATEDGSEFKLPRASVELLKERRR